MNLAGIAIRGSSGLELEVSTFISVTGITDSTIISALDNLVKSLKSYNLWSLLKAIYPLVGGNATAHSYNLKDTSLYQITWSGGLTHNANGVTGNGTTGYGNTGIVPSSVLTLNSTHIGAYIRVNNSGGSMQTNMGCNDSGATNILNIKLWSSVQYTAAINGNEASTNASPITGWFVGSRTGSSSLASSFFRNGSLIANYIGTSTARSAQPIALLARNNAGTIAEYSASNHAFFTIGDGLTNTQSANLFTAIQAFQTELGRQV